MHNNRLSCHKRSFANKSMWHSESTVFSDDGNKVHF